MSGIMSDKLDSLTKRRRDFIWLLLLGMVLWFLCFSFISTAAILDDLRELSPDLVSKLYLSISELALLVLVAATMLFGFLSLLLSAQTLLQRGLSS